MRRSFPRTGLWFLPPERLHDQVRDLPGGRRLRIRGQFDAALADLAQARLEVIDFKCRPDDQPVRDLMQVALYSWLLEKSTGLAVAGVLMYLEADDGAVRFNVDQLREVASSPETDGFLSAVHDVLVSTAGKAQSRSGPGGPLRPLPAHHGANRPMMAPASTSGAAPMRDDETAEVQSRLLKALSQLHCVVQPLAPIIGPRLMRFRVVPEPGQTSVRKLEGLAKDLQVALGTPSPPLVRAGEGYVSIDVPRRRQLPLTLTETLEKGLPDRPESVVAFPLGMALDGRIVWADLASPTMTSILVGGTAGSGKSEFLKSAVVGMALSAAPDRLRMTLVDPKLVTFTQLRKLPHLEGGLYFEPQKALEEIGRLVGEMEQCYRTFADTGVSHIDDYGRNHRPLPHHVVIIDEYADLMTEKGDREKLEPLIQRLGQKGRAAGYHLILATQRPDAKVVSGLIKANLQLKVALKVSTSVNSQVILDERGAENLLGHGDMLVGGSIALQRLQAPLCTRTEMERVLAPGKS